MNNIFAEVWPKMRSALKNTSNYELNFGSLLSVYPYPTDTIEIHQIFENLESKSSSGIDEIINVTVKAAGPVICEHMVFLINKSLSYGIFPSSLKLAKVLPLHKNGSKDDVHNYRPISLLVVGSKIFERVVFNRIFNYLEEHSYINENQFGFRKKHNTIDAVAKLVEVRDSKFKMELIAFLLDIKKAFDTIDHDILLHKLDRYGIRGKSLKWTESFLTDRKQCVENENAFSDWRKIECGVPQGSILGPLLFLVYINDLPLACMKCQAFLFADDTCLLGTNCTIEELQADLLAVSDWLQNNKLTLNIKKTFQLNLTLGKYASSPNFHLNNKNLNVLNSCKYLGVFLDNKLSFKPHIESVIERLERQCGIVSKLRHYVPRNVLLRYYSSNIKPIIQYGLLVYGCVSYRILEPILKMQKKFLRLILFLKYRQSVSEYFDNLNNLTVQELYVYELLKFVLRSLNNLHTDDYLNSLYEFDVTTYSTRRSQKSFLKISKCRKILETNLLKYRRTKLLNIFIDNGILGSKLCNMSQTVFTKTVHDLRDSFILANYDLIAKIFE